MKARPLILCAVSILLLILAKSALAEGAYQRTEDRKKTLVWNNDPKPGDTATWSGGRDSDGYAMGPGTLNWFRIDRNFTTGSNVSGRKRTPISSYSGTMVRGKLTGGVMTVDHGKTYHATFVDGQKKGHWIAGPLVAKAESVETAPAVEKSERAESATSTAAASQAPSPEKVSEEKAQARVAEEKTEDVPAEGPAEEKSEIETPEVAKSTATEQEKPETTRKASQPLSAQASTEQPDQSATPREPLTKKSPVPAEKIQTPTAKSAIAESAPPSSKETPVDDSIRTLTGPPSSLHVSAPPETNPPDQITTPSTAAVSPPPSTGPKLTAVQAMDIADIEARTKGYDLGEYQLPKAEYNAATDTWSVGYVGRDSEKEAKKLSVTIQDKTGKAEVKK